MFASEVVNVKVLDVDAVDEDVTFVREVKVLEEIDEPHLDRPTIDKFLASVSFRLNIMNTFFSLV